MSMLYAITQDLRAAMKAQGCPFPVEYGPEKTDTTAIMRTRVVVEYGDRDAFTKPTATHPNPRMSHVRRMDCRFRVFAQSTLPNAGVQDHERLAEQIVDMVVSELDVIAKVRKNTWSMNSGGFVDLSDTAPNKVRHGVVYEGSFGFDRGLARRTWQGEARPTAPLNGVSTEAGVSLDGNAYQPVNLS